jgi:Hemolysin-type calcium-binding repeat (2 copies).
LVLTGTAAVNATGNSVANLLVGNIANNILDGGLGADTLQGGLGDDVYIVDDALDVIQEDSNAGNDSVQAVVTYALAVNLENLLLTGALAINGTGNSLANALTGNAANNTLDGGAGADP